MSWTSEKCFFYKENEISLYSVNLKLMPFTLFNLQTYSTCILTLPFTSLSRSLRNQQKVESLYRRTYTFFHESDITPSACNKFNKHVGN